MFKRNWDPIPKGPAYADNLNDLGFTVNTSNQIVNKETGKFYELHISDNENDSLTRREAFRAATREEVKSQLARHGVKEVYLTGCGADDVQTSKPIDKHISILATDLDVLKKKNHVVVVIPDRNQELGIVAYRDLNGAAGIDRGSVLELVKKLQLMTLKNASFEKTVLSLVIKYLHRGEKNVEGAASDDVAPGIVVLNPGELLYSHKYDKCMNERSWMYKPKIHALEEAAEIDEEHNRVPGHKTPNEHVSTVLGKILPHVLRFGSHVYVISMEAGAEYLVNYMGNRLSNPVWKMLIPGCTTKALAFVNPTHDPEKVTPDIAKHKITALGKSWDLSEQRRGTILTQPAPLDEGVLVCEDFVISDPIEIPHNAKRRLVAPRGRRSTFDASVLAYRPPFPEGFRDYNTSEGSNASSRTKAKEAEDKDDASKSSQSTSSSAEPAFFGQKMSGDFKKPAKALVGGRHSSAPARLESTRDGDLSGRSPMHHHGQAVDSPLNRSRLASPVGSQSRISPPLELEELNEEIPRGVLFQQARPIGQAGPSTLPRTASSTTLGLLQRLPGGTGVSNEAVVYSSSEYSSEEPGSGLLIGGDFDDDGTEGLRMKDYKTHFRDMSPRPAPLERKPEREPAGEKVDDKEDVDTNTTVPPLQLTRATSQADDQDEHMSAEAPPLKPMLGATQPNDRGGKDVNDEAPPLEPALAAVQPDDKENKAPALTQPLPSISEPGDDSKESEDKGRFSLTQHPPSVFESSSDEDNEYGGVPLTRQPGPLLAAPVPHYDGHDSSSSSSLESLNFENLAQLRYASADLHADVGHPATEVEKADRMLPDSVTGFDGHAGEEGSAGKEEEEEEEPEEPEVSMDEAFAAVATALGVPAEDLEVSSSSDSQALTQLDGGDAAGGASGEAEPVPEVGDMWHVSSGLGEDAELIFSAVVDEVLAFVEQMSEKTHD